jgi:hypothetical protein
VFFFKKSLGYVLTFGEIKGLFDKSLGFWSIIAKCGVGFLKIMNSK